MKNRLIILKMCMALSFFTTLSAADAKRMPDLLSEISPVIQKAFTESGRIYTPYKYDLVSFAPEDLVTLSYPSFQALVLLATTRIAAQKSSCTEKVSSDWLKNTEESIKKMVGEYKEVHSVEKYHSRLGVNILIKEINIPEKEAMRLLQCASHFTRNKKIEMDENAARSECVTIFFASNESVSMQALGKILELIEKYRQYES